MGPSAYRSSACKCVSATTGDRRPGGRWTTTRGCYMGYERTGRRLRVRVVSNCRRHHLHYLRLPSPLNRRCPNHRNPTTRWYPSPLTHLRFRCPNYRTAGPACFRSHTSRPRNRPCLGSFRLRMQYAWCDAFAASVILGDVVREVTNDISHHHPPTGSLCTSSSLTHKPYGASGWAAL